MNGLEIHDLRNLAVVAAGILALAAVYLLYLKILSRIFPSETNDDIPFTTYSQPILKVIETDLENQSVTFRVAASNNLRDTREELRLTVPREVYAIWIRKSDLDKVTGIIEKRYAIEESVLGRVIRLRS